MKRIILLSLVNLFALGLFSSPSYSGDAIGERMGFSITAGNGWSRYSFAAEDTAKRVLKISLMSTSEHWIGMCRAVYAARPISPSRFVDVSWEGGFLAGPRVNLETIAHAYCAVGLGIAHGRYTHSEWHGDWWSGWGTSTVDAFTTVCLPYEIGVVVTPLPWIGIGWTGFGNLNFRNKFGGNGLSLTFLFDLPAAKPHPNKPNPYDW